MVLVVGIGIVRVYVRHGIVAMHVVMRRTCGNYLVMRVLVMRVVLVFMLMLEYGVLVCVVVALGNVQPHAQPHQRTGKQ